MCRLGQDLRISHLPCLSDKHLKIIMIATYPIFQKLPGFEQSVHSVQVSIFLKINLFILIGGLLLYSIVVVLPYIEIFKLDTQVFFFLKTTYLFIFSTYFYSLEANYFTILQWFLLYIDMNQPWSYMCSPSRSPLPPPSPSHPSGSSQCTSPEHPSHASNLGW